MIQPPASVYELVERQFGVKLGMAENTEGTTIGTTAGVIAKNNPRRVALVVVNLSANQIYIRPAQAPSATAGILVPPNGGSITMNANDDMILPSLEWQAVASGAASAYYTLELMIVAGVRK